MEHFKQIQAMAEAQGWETIALQPDNYMISFRKDKVRVNVYEGYRGITVVTSLEHPVKGKTQLVRKNAGMKMIDQVFKNPRVHTGVGYYQLPKRKQPDNNTWHKAPAPQLPQPSIKKRMIHSLIKFLMKFQ